MKIHSVLNLNAEKELRRPLVNHPERYRTVAVDFDGVLSKSDGPYSRKHFGPPIPEGIALVKKLLDEGWEVIVLTARTETDLVAGWLRDHGLPGLLVTNHKIPAAAYIDDRAVHAYDNFKKEDIIKEIEKRPHK